MPARPPASMVARCSSASTVGRSGSSCSPWSSERPRSAWSSVGSLRHLKEDLREPFGVLQAALLGVVGLILAFGLALAVGRYEARRAAVVDEANAIGTTYLRAQTLAEPVRSRSLALLTDYTDTRISLSLSVPGSSQARRVIAQGELFLRQLLDARWPGARYRSDRQRPPALHRESEHDDRHGHRSRIDAEQPGSRGGPRSGGARRRLRIGVARGLPVDPGPRRSGGPPGAILVTLLLLVTFDLDRPTRGLIRVPDTPLVALRASMELPPAAAAPTVP